jgi:hypothetical protein
MESKMKLNVINLCNSCQKEFAVCSKTDIIFGNDVGNDNVMACSGYVPYVLSKDVSHAWVA